MNDSQRDAESRFGGTRFNLKPVTQDPVYPKDGDSWFRVDEGLMKVKIGGVIYGFAMVDSTGKILASQIPNLAITDTFVVASQAEMLALDAQTGDIAIRTDSSEVYILKANPASTLSNWQVLTSIAAAVSSVNGEVGVVSLDTDDIPEGSLNLYYTDARFDTRFGTKSTSDLPEGSNLYYTAARFNTAFAGKSTTDLAEGANLYYTNARFDTRFATKTTDGLTEGATNLYYTTARFDARFASKTTTNLAEGTNLYYTNSRFDTRFATKSTTNLPEGTNLYYTTARANTDFDTRLVTKSTTDLAEGTHLYFTSGRADTRIALQKGVANGLATLDPTGKIPVSQLPGEGTLETFIVASQAAMLALSAQKGDIAKRTDTKEIYILSANPATILSNWELLATDYNANVDSVNGQTHTVALTTGDIPEGSNLYYTAARFNSAFAAKSTTDLAEGTNLYYTQARFDSAFAAKSTTNLSEGSNLYYTTARANSDFDTRLATKSTDDLTEGSNLYYTTARANTDFDTRLATKSTSDLAEGSNLYYTNARFDTRFGTKTTTDLAEGLNLYYTNARADARISLQKGAANGIATLGADSKIPSAQLPALAITDTFVVGSQAAMLALTAETGDVAVRTDLNKTFILRGTDPTVLSDWQELLTPTDSVLSVNGFTGAVVLTTSNISEGSNLYYTDERVDDRVANLIQNGTGISWLYNDAGNTLTPTVTLSPFSTTDLAEGANLYYTSARFNTAFSGKTTTDLAEGTNLYYTAARFNTAFAGKTTSDLSEGTNLYYTAARFNTAFAAKSTSDLSEGTNLYYTTARANADFDTRLATKTTTNLSEGSNLYYTDERVDDRVAVLIQNGTGISWVYNDAGNTLTPTVTLAPFSTTNLTEGTNLYYTAARFNTAFAAKTTTDLTEGTNLYYTTARANSDFDTRLATKSTTNLAEGTNLYYTTARANTDFDTRLATKTTTNLAEGTNLYYTDARVRANRLDQMTAPNTDLSINSHKLTNVTDPTSAQDAATKAYVDRVQYAMTSPTQIAANQNDYNPGTGKVFRLTSDVNNRVITGLSVSQADGTEIILINVNSSNFNIVLNNQDTGSTAANRFQLSTNANINLSRFSSMRFLYDATTQRWRDV